MIRTVIYNVAKTPLIYHTAFKISYSYFLKINLVFFSKPDVWFARYLYDILYD